MENLMHAPIIKLLDYQGKLQAQALINRGMTIGPLYFWYNVKAGNYSALPGQVLQKDLDHFCRKYPAFKEDFINATKNIDNG